MKDKLKLTNEEVLSLMQNDYAEVPISFQSYDRVVSEELTKNSPFRNIMMSLQKTNIELAERFNAITLGKDFNEKVFSYYQEGIGNSIEYMCINSLRSLVRRSVVNYVFDTLNYLNCIGNNKRNLFDIILSNTKDPRFTEVYNNIQDIENMYIDILTKNIIPYHNNNEEIKPEVSPYLYSSLQIDFYNDQFDTVLDIGDFYQDMIAHSMYNNVMNMITNLIQISLQNNFTEIRELIYKKYKSDYKGTPNEFMDIQNWIFYSLQSPIRELNYNVSLFAGYIMEMIRGSMFYGFADYVELNKLEGK